MRLNELQARRQRESNIALPSHPLAHTTARGRGGGNEDSDNVDNDEDDEDDEDGNESDDDMARVLRFKRRVCREARCCAVSAPWMRQWRKWIALDDFDFTAPPGPIDNEVSHQPWLCWGATGFDSCFCFCVCVCCCCCCCDLSSSPSFLPSSPSSSSPSSVLFGSIVDRWVVVLCSVSCWG